MMPEIDKKIGRLQEMLTERMRQLNSVALEVRCIAAETVGDILGPIPESAASNQKDSPEATCWIETAIYAAGAIVTSLEDIRSSLSRLRNE